MMGTEQSVRCAPSMTSFSLALVSATLMRLSSASSFPACCLSLLRTCKEDAAICRQPKNRTPDACTLDRRRHKIK